MPGPLGTWPSDGDGRRPGPLGFGPSIIFFADPAPAVAATPKSATPKAATQVLYVHPKNPPPTMLKPEKDKPARVFKWSFDDGNGRQEYEAALDKHLRDQKVISGNVTYAPLDHVADIGKLASTSAANLVLIVHGAGDTPSIAVDLGNSAAGIKGDWIKADKFAPIIAQFGFKGITVLGCDSISNDFTPNLAKLLPKGGTVTGHKGGYFEIKPHYEADLDNPGTLKLTSMTSNLALKSFQTSGP
jgi:hypothetical protein